MSLKLGLSSVIALALVLTGCASTGKEWVGRPINEAIAKLGKPETRARSLDGEYEVRRWSTAKGYTQNVKVGQSVASTNFGNVTVDHYQQVSGFRVCHTYLITQWGSNIVVRSGQRGSDCPSSKPDPTANDIIVKLLPGGL